MLRHGRVVEVRVRGDLTRADYVALLAEMEHALAAAGGPCVIVGDTTALETWEPGSAALVARWLARNAPRVAGSIFVTRRPMLRGIAAVFRVLVPSVPQDVCATRDEAMARAAVALRPRGGGERAREARSARGA